MSGTAAALGGICALDRHAYPGLSYQLERSPGGISAAAPCFGQHNEPVLRDILGIRAETIAELQRAGAIADRPLSVQLTTTASAASATAPRQTRQLT